VTAKGVSAHTLVLPAGVSSTIALRSGDRKAHSVVLHGPSALRLTVPAKRVIHPDFARLAAGRYGVRVDGAATGAVITMLAPPG
jgi:hypothetical protein